MGFDFEKVYAEIRGLIAEDEVFAKIKKILEDEKKASDLRRKSVQAEGIARAKENHVKFGRKRIEKPSNYEKIMGLYQKKDISLDQGAKLLNVSRSVFYSWVCEEREKAAKA
ncbi:MAG: hypothetical protein MJ141_06480 [Clostridia bacterium]|nr:hypothetical protein [Clostridia bacterium]